jgi:hypothetical protein
MPGDLVRLAGIHPAFRRKAGVSKAEQLDILKSVRFTAAEQRQLPAATKQANEVLGHAGGRYWMSASTGFN